MKILLAEDNELNQQLGIRLLRRQGHEVTLARDGEEAVALVTKKPDAFDVVLMDMQMPIMDGIEATIAIRRREAEVGGRLPIIALTAHFGPDKLRQCLEAGMDGGVTKPLDLAELDAAIAKAATGADASERAPRASVIGWDAALDLVLGDEALLRDMAGLFLGRTDSMLADVADAHERGAAHELERAAHKLKGSAGNFGAADVVGLAQQVEDAAEAEDLEAAGSLLDPLRAALTAACAELAARAKEPDA